MRPTFPAPGKATSTACLFRFLLFPLALTVVFGSGLSGCVSPLPSDSSRRSQGSENSAYPLPATHVKEIANTNWDSVIPSGYDYPEVFDGYWQGSVAAWSRNWTRRINLTGVAWDKPQAGTLISPRHILFARHFPRSKGETIVFHNRRGKPIARTIVATRVVEGIQLPDLVVALLDEAVPIDHYRVLPPRSDWGALLEETGVFIATSQHKLLTGRISRIQNGIITFTSQATANKYLVAALESGDSGHPAFLLLHNEPILLETHTHGGPGSGPFLSDPIVFLAINRTMETIGGGFRLDAVNVE